LPFRVKSAVRATFVAEEKRTKVRISMGISALAYSPRAAGALTVFTTRSSWRVVKRLVELIR